MQQAHNAEHNAIMVHADLWRVRRLENDVYRVKTDTTRGYNYTHPVVWPHVYSLFVGNTARFIRAYFT